MRKRILKKSLRDTGYTSLGVIFLIFAVLYGVALFSPAIFVLGMLVGIILLPFGLEGLLEFFLYVPLIILLLLAIYFFRRGFSPKREVTKIRNKKQVKRKSGLFRADE